MKNIYLFIFSLFVSLNFYSTASANGIVCNVTVDDAHCNGEHGGAIIEATGGTAPYSYAWSDGNITNTGADINAGMYSVTVSDATGCTSECTFTIPANTPQVSIVCGDGELTAFVDNVTPPFTYTWSTGETTETIAVVDGEFYSVVITEQGGCQGNAGQTYSELTTFSCNNQLNVGLTATPNGNGSARIYLQSFLQGDYATCDVDYQVKLEDVNGEEVIPFTSQFIQVDCSYIGDYIYIVMDMVSGESCTGNLKIEDKTGPVIICNNLAVATLVGDEVELTADFFDEGSAVTCGDIRFTFTDTPPEQDPTFDPVLGASSRTFTCDEFFAFNGQVEVFIYAWNDDGDYSMCWTILTLQIDMDNPCTLDGNYVRVMQGVCNLGPEPQYSLSLNQSTEVDLSTCLGFLSEDDLLTGVNTLTINDNNLSGMNGDGMNGVSTLDIVGMLGGLTFGMGDGGFNTPFEAIAMDIDSDGAISTLDLLEVRRRVLGLSQSFDQEEDYKILLTETDFGSDFNPYDMGTDFLSFEFVSSDFDGLFLPVTVIKSGDINFTASFTSEEESETRAISLLNYSDKFIKAGQTKVIEFTLDAATDIKATTFKLSGDGLTYENIDAFGQDVIVNYQDGDAFISFVNYNEAESTFEFNLEVTADSDVRMSDAIILAGNINEVVSSTLSIDEISLTANASTSSDNLENKSMSIFPNPAKNVINISFDQAMSREVKLISLSGQSFGEIESKDASLRLDVADMNDGIYFLHVNSSAGSQIQKILIQK